MADSLLPDMATPDIPDAAAGRPTTTVYRVLARKYRPTTFDDLIGQEALVRTLGNAFEAERVHQAYIFTGVRGVGKTTSARIVARGLNYELADMSVARPTIRMPALGVHCQAIMESRHMDVIEMDAASNTGIGDVREIIEAVRYKPASARYKVYIIDEVHMLSTAAFNGLLKTLEEPPPHVKFLFATTEIRKVPVTVLSRCQRFDLRRVEADVMMTHLRGICAAEAVSISDEALALIVRAGEGSVRDCLSLLDQAIAHGAGTIGAEAVRAMLGLADRARIIDLFEMVMRGDMPATLAEVAAQYAAGADPAVLVADLAEFVHYVTRLKLAPAAGADPMASEAERKRGEALARGLSIRVLTRAWQILLKGLQEVQAAARPLAAAEMLMVRLAYVADLPTPDDALRMLRDGAPNGPGAGSSGASAPRGSGPGGPGGQSVARQQPAPRDEAVPTASLPARQALRVENLEQIVALADAKGDYALKVAVDQHVHLVRIEPGRLDVALEPAAQPDLAQTLGRRLTEWTGQRWMVVVSNETGEPTLNEKRRAARAEEERGVRALPLVRAVLERFPGAEIVSVRSRSDMAAASTTPETAAAGEPDHDGTEDPTLYTDDDL